MSEFAKNIEAKYNSFFKKITTKRNGLPNILSPIYLTHSFISKAISAKLDCFNGKLLDVGSGNSPYSLIFKDRISHYISMDYLPILNGEGCSKPVIYSNGKKIAVKSNSIDSILCTQVLEYIDFPDEFLREFHRVIKPDGKVIITVPFMYPVHHKELDFFRYTDLGIKKILERNGFQVNFSEQMGGFWVFMIHMFTHYTSYRLFRNVPGRLLKMIFGILKILLTPVLLLLNLMLNLSALLLEIIDTEETFTLNYFIVAEKKLKQEIISATI